MPTPFYHLCLAQQLVADTALPPVLCAERAAFYLGNIAPDAQNVSGQTREATHFFDVPMRDSTPAWRAMFRQHPSLARSSSLPPAQAAFMAGYLCHLALDQMWIAAIFDPIFGEEAQWATFRERLFLHNVLRIYLDERDRPTLLEDTGQLLRRAYPERWLPFLADEALIGWRDFVGGQLAEGGSAQTVAVFARRMGLENADFESLLQSPTALQSRLFPRVSLEALARFRAEGLARSRQVVADYLTDSRS